MGFIDQAGPSTVSFRDRSKRVLGYVSCATAFLMGCSSGDPGPGGDAGAAGSGNPTAGATFGGAGGTPSIPSGGSQPVGTAGSLSPTAGAAGAPVGGQPPTNGGAPSAGANSVAGMGGLIVGGAGGLSGGTGGSGTSTGGSAGSSNHPKDHCVYGYDPHPTDATMKDGPAEFTKGGQIDLTVQLEVIKWMEDNEWQPAHFEWHSIRRCGGGGLGGMSKVNICSFKSMIPADQECKSTGDGLQFLAMHRHMIQSLKQLWPKHTEQFEGWEKFPTTKAELPQQWQADFRDWPDAVLDRAKIADEIDKPENLSRFPTEGHFGMWLQCFQGQAIPNGPAASGLHGDLHFKWVRSQNTEHGLGNQFRNIDNYMFWKMHGWIDKVWEKYRKAKGLTPDEPAHKAAILAQCREMDALAAIVNPDLAMPDPMEPTPTETGVFHTTIRPLFENDTTKCSGCHGPTAPEGGLTLGGSGASSASILAALVSKPSKQGGQFQLVVPGDPTKSWLYLKAAGMAASAGCTPSGSAACNPQPMPPTTGVRMTATELETLRKWIADGAKAQ